jgi:drug/metabolite transporter (DMT)-like permease
MALVGLAGLARPGRTAPDPLGLGLMALAGLAWAAYTLRGRGAADPLAATADNFRRSVPFALAALPLDGGLDATAAGLGLAVASGALASGLGYTLWYAALRGLSRTQAAVVQLAVPVLAALGGILLLGESFGLRLALCGATILCGVAIALSTRR